MSELKTVIANQFALTPDDLRAATPSGSSLFANRLSWAVAYLRQGGLVHRPRRGVVQITSRGQEVLARHPDHIDRDVLQFEESAQWYEFRAFVLQVLHRTWGAEPKETVGLGYRTMTGDQGADLVLDRRGQTVLVDVKLQTPQTSARLLSVAKELVS